MLSISDNKLLTLPDGSFDSEECLNLLDDADIVVTNPPFSNLRHFFDTIKNKKYLFIAPLPAISKYKPIVWAFINRETFITKRICNYATPDGYVKLNNTIWIENIAEPVREYLDLSKPYNPNKHIKYHNYNAIDISSIKDIPYDYDGVMGVPVTFLQHHNWNQFELLGVSGKDPFNFELSYKYEHPIHVRENGSTESGSKVNSAAVIWYADKPDGDYYIADNLDGYLKMKFTRLFIRKIDDKGT